MYEHYLLDNPTIVHNNPSSEEEGQDNYRDSEFMEEWNGLDKSDSEFMEEWNNVDNEVVPQNTQEWVEDWEEVE